MFKRVLVANRGEVARRIMRTCRGLGVGTVAVYSDADRDALHVREADHAVHIGGAASHESYLRGAAVVEAARTTGADAVHPGYGFLSEDAEFARAVIDAGISWVGPDPKSISTMGDKIVARNLMASAGVPVARGTTEPLSDLDEAIAAGREVGYPLMVKAAAGGGGIGMSVARSEEDLVRGFTTARDRASRAFGSPAILLERFVENARHVEVQVFGLEDGSAVVLGERDCSIQRRHQKVLEETPSPFVDADLRREMQEAARRAAEAIDYRGAGTVEFLVDTDSREFLFLEMNTRLQVEHPVTEEVTGIDLVEQQLRLAAGLPTTMPSVVEPKGHAVEFRVYAEDPVTFLPGPGRIQEWREPTGERVRVDGAYGPGDLVTPFYDPLLAKLVVWGEDRPEALERLARALDSFEIQGPKVNLALGRELLASEAFQRGEYDTRFIERLR